MIRVVLDTNILFSAVFKSSGTQATLICLMAENQIITSATVREPPATFAKFRRKAGAKGMENAGRGRRSARCSKI